jgi:glycosyltransferase involved in cell wall biosynthesis
MKLLIFSHFFFPGFGGVEKQALMLASGLAQGSGFGPSCNFDVTVVTKTPGKESEDSGFPFKIVRCPSFFRLCGLVWRSDVIHLAGPSLLPLLISYLFRKPIAIEHHGYQAICPNGSLIQEPTRSLCPGHFQAGNYMTCFRCLASESSGFTALKRLFLMIPRYSLPRRISANIAITKHVLDRHRLPASRTIYYGIEPRHGSRAVATGDKSGKFRFAFVGRFSAEKGILVLLDAAKILESQGLGFELRLIGDGPERPKVEGRIRELGLVENVHLVGYIAAGEPMAEALADIRAVVVPSTCEETAGFSAIEQMMDGRLVIASSIGGLAEVVGDGGLLVPAGDAAALASVMRQAVVDPGLVTEISAKGQARAQKMFVVDRMLREHAKLYCEIQKRSL